MSYRWFGGMTLKDFWQPITAPSEQWWRDLHIRAHVLGGVLWDVVFHFLVFVGINFPHSVWLRLLGVGVVQLTLWEMIQRENWRPAPHQPSAYPWLSAIWDVLFTVAGASILELLLWGLHVA